MIYVVSDIHGCFHTLEKLLDKINTKDSDPRLIFVGDYVDRGLHSKKVIDLVIELQKQGAVCLRGNHDDIVSWICSGESSTDLQEMIRGEVTQSSVATWWLVNGLFPTIQSYVNMELSGNTLEFILQMFVGSVPQEHKDFLLGLNLFWENETHFACHAYLDPTKELPRTLTFLPESSTMDLLWSRFPAAYTDTMYGGRVPSGLDVEHDAWDRIGVFGHTPVGVYGGVAPIKHGNIRLIDTGAFQGGYLASYIVEQDDHILQATDSRDIISS